ncbi:hypothetical protein ABW20_dc0105839 [Dactylellina cionopaga]|nr:hypothetical protein ABW20_dc0105839 [Dactylellina cionopaga]
MGGDNYEDSIYDRIRKGDIEVIRDTITSMQERTITFASGEKLAVDAVIFATGWKKSLPFLSGTLAMQLGLPSASYTAEYMEKWKLLEAKADKRIYQENPILKTAPQLPKIISENTGKYRLYHHCIPTEFADRSIAVMGALSTGSTLQHAMVGSLWTAAYMLGKLDLPPKEEIEETAAYEIRFSQIRHSGAGLNPWMKKGWFNELFGPYTCKDYGNLSERWIEKHGICEYAASSPKIFKQ